MDKLCLRCNVKKTLVEFHKDSSKVDGKRTYCKLCVNQAGRAYSKKYARQRSERAKKDRRLNPDKYRAWAKASYERTKEQKKQYAKENQEHIRQRVAKHRKKYPHKHRARNAQRYAQKIQATPSWADLEKIEHVYWVCHFISELTGIKHQVDHIHPLKGKDICGLHVHTNLQILTAEQNLAKGNRWKNEHK